MTAPVPQALFSMHAMIGGPNVNNISGFGDVIFLSEAFFTAASMLSLDIRYHPLEAQRSGPGIFDALGVNKAMSAVLKHDIIDDGAPLIITIPYMTQLSDLETWIENARSALEKTPHEKKETVIFKFRENIKHSAIAFLSLSYIYKPELVPMSRYFALPTSFSARTRAKSLFEGKGLKVLIHVRRGDICLVTLDDGRVISPWGVDGDLLHPAAVDDLSRLTQPYVPDAVYVEIAALLADRFAALPMETVVVSDGHLRGCDLLARGASKSLLSDSDIASLPRLSQQHDDEMVRFYKQRLSAEVYIGEQSPDMVAVCATIIDADVVVSLSAGFIGSVIRNFNPPERSKTVITNSVTKAIIDIGCPDTIRAYGCDPTSIDLKAVAEFLM